MKTSNKITKTLKYNTNTKNIKIIQTLQYNTPYLIIFGVGVRNLPKEYRCGQEN